MICTMTLSIDYTGDLGKRGLARQLGEVLRLPERLAYAVAKDTLLRLRAAEPSDSSFNRALGDSLAKVLGRAELALIQTVPRILGTPGVLLQQAGEAPGTPRPPRPGAGGAGMGLGGAIVGGLVEGASAAVVEWLLNQTGATADGTSAVIEAGGAWDDGYAPTIRDGKMSVSLAPVEGNNCCTTGLGGRGIRTRVVFEVTDNTGPWYSNDSGVVSTELSVVIGEGENRALKSLGRKDYTSAEEAATEDGFMREEREVCVPCAAVKNGVIYFVLKIVDDDGNSRMIVQPEPVGAAAANCCG